jgi:hypothetical protein
MHHLYHAVTQVKNLAVDRLVNREIRLCKWTEDDWSAGGLRQVKMAAHKISVKMGFKNVLDGCLSLPGKIQIYIYIPQGVNNRRFTATLDIVCRFAKTTGIQLLDEHNAAFFYRPKADAANPGAVAAKLVLNQLIHRRIS